MKESQTRHLNRIKREFNDLINVKFEKGAKEHGTLLHELSPEWLLDQAIDEALDQVTYLLTLKERLKSQDWLSNFDKEVTKLEQIIEGGR